MTIQDKSVSPELVRWNPWAELSWPHRFGQFIENAWNRLPDTLVPAGSLEETDTAFVLELDLPGVVKDDIAVDVTGRRVSVSGTRTEKERDGVLRQSTLTTGRFAYEVTLPSPIDDGTVTATLKDGILTITIPKGSEAKTTKVEIK